MLLVDNLTVASASAEVYLYYLLLSTNGSTGNLCLLSVQGLGVSIARGTGRQTLGAVIIFVSYYIIALPIGVPLMFATSLGLAGIAHFIAQNTARVYSVVLL